MSNRLAHRTSRFDLRLPPEPPERGGGEPRRLHVVINIVVRPVPPRRPWLGLLGWFLWR